MMASVYVMAWAATRNLRRIPFPGLILALLQVGPHLLGLSAAAFGQFAVVLAGFPGLGIHEDRVPDAAIRAAWCASK
ncbi:MAG: hypothetical protein HOC60_05810 [Rhodospirillaceae bacterium]|nr:hypothetical protein [Rhodospirillaceae bacterium]